MRRAEYDSVAVPDPPTGDDQFVDAVENLWRSSSSQQRNVSTLAQRFFPEVVVDDGGYVGVNRVVIADAVADRTGITTFRPWPRYQTGHPSTESGRNCMGSR